MTKGRLRSTAAHHAGDDRLAGGHAERAAHEIEVLHGGDHGHLLDRAGADHHRVDKRGLGARVAQPLGIAALVAELERIDRHLGQWQALVSAVVEEMLQALGRIHAHVVAGAGDDELVQLKVAMEDHLAGLRTLDPQIGRHLPLVEEIANLRADDVVDPAHVTFSPFEGPIPPRACERSARPRPAPKPAPTRPARSVRWRAPRYQAKCAPPRQSRCRQPRRRRPCRSPALDRRS